MCFYVLVIKTREKKTLIKLFLNYLLINLFLNFILSMIHFYIKNYPMCFSNA